MQVRGKTPVSGKINSHSCWIILLGQGNTVLTDDYTLENYNGKKVIITVLDDEKQFSAVSDEKLFSVSDSLINQNIEAYKELAKWINWIWTQYCFWKTE